MSESYGDGVTIVIVGVTPHQGKRENRLHRCCVTGKSDVTEIERYAFRRTAETILNIIRKRGQRGLPVEDVYRLLYNPDLYLQAAAKLNSNAGAMTPGAGRGNSGRDV